MKILQNPESKTIKMNLKTHITLVNKKAQKLKYSDKQIRAIRSPDIRV